MDNTKIELEISMLANASRLFAELNPDHVSTDRIKEFQKMFNDVQEITPVNSAQWGSMTIHAMDIAADMYVVSSLFQQMTHARLEKSEAEAYFVRSVQYLTATGVKDTSAAREKYIEMDEVCNHTKNIEVKWAALARYFDEKRGSFQFKHNWVKKRIEQFLHDKV